MVFVYRATRAEVLKLRRTLALLVCLAAPISVIGIIGANIVGRGPNAKLPGADPWHALLDNFTLFLWCRLALPLLVALVTALLAELEHGDNHWTRLFTLAAPRWSVYVAKLIAAALLLLLSSTVLAGGVGLLGIALNQINPSLGLVAPVPWRDIVGQVATVCVSAFLLLAIQAWLALRSASFAVACGVGIGGTVAALILSFTRAGARIGAIFPWAMAAAAVPTPPEAAVSSAIVLTVAILGAVVVSTLGCWEFVRRDIT